MTAINVMNLNHVFPLPFQDDHPAVMHRTSIHVRNVNANPQKAKLHPWSVATKLGSWTHLMGWNQFAGDGTYYKVSHRKYHGKNVKVFKAAGGYDMAVFQHNYTSKKLAKHFAKSSEIIQ